jgi:hypothetical protein
MKNFRALKPFGDVAGSLKVEVGTGAVLCMIPEPMPIDERNWYVPARII